MKFIKSKLFILTLIILNAMDILYAETTSESLDRIIAIIYHAEGSDIVLESDLKSPFDGTKLPQEELIFRKLVEIDGKMLNATVTDESVDRYLAQIQKSQNLTQEQLLEAIKPLTLEKFKDELKVKLMVQNVIDYRVTSKVVIDKQEIEKYYHQNPVYQEASYTLTNAFVGYGDSSPTIKKIKLQEAIEMGLIDEFVKWDSPIELKEDQIAQEKAFVKDLNVGSTTILDANNNGLFVMRLIDKKPKRLLELKEREEEILNTLQQEKYMKTFQEYKCRLMGLETESNSIASMPRIAVVKYID